MELRIYLRSNRTDRLGMSVIYFIVGDEWMSTGIKCPAADWDDQACTIRKSHPQYSKVSPKFLSKKSKAETALNLLQLQQRPFDKRFFLEYINEGLEAAENPSFTQLIDEYCKMQDVSLQRVKHYDALKVDILKLLVRPKLHDINFQFIGRLKLSLKNKKDTPNNENTISRKVKQVKAVINYAVRAGLLKNNPLSMVKVKDIKGDKNFLNAAELKILEDLYAGRTLQESYQVCLQYFLFSCYTSLRFSDVVKLNRTHFINNSIRIIQTKTKKPVFIPLIEPAMALITVQSSGRLFKTFCNQPTNRYLKEIMIIAGIDKHITYHCSRHTFGTLAIYWGIPKEVVADIMGIDMKTADVYARIIEEVKIREMQKWGKITA